MNNDLDLIDDFTDIDKNKLTWQEKACFKPASDKQKLDLLALAQTFQFHEGIIKQLMSLASHSVNTAYRYVEFQRIKKFKWSDRRSRADKYSQK